MWHCVNAVFDESKTQTNLQTSKISWRIFAGYKNTFWIISALNYMAHFKCQAIVTLRMNSRKVSWSGDLENEIIKAFLAAP